MAKQKVEDKKRPPTNWQQEQDRKEEAEWKHITRTELKNYIRRLKQENKLLRHEITRMQGKMIRYGLKDKL